MPAGENIGVAVAREVFEETGIRAEFISIVSMRHILQYQFSRGDFYIACHMRPTTFAIKPCEHEISDCRWMKVRFMMQCACVCVCTRMSPCTRDTFPSGIMQCNWIDIFFSVHRSGGNF